MRSRIVKPPVIGRTDAGLVLISYWTVQSVDHQKHAASLAMRLWNEGSWPDGMISHHVYGGDDGRTVMNYSQWRDDAAFNAYLAGDQPERVRHIEADPADISRDAIDRFRIYRSIKGAAKGALSECLVLVTFDVDSAARQRQLVDRVISTAHSLPAAPPGAYKSGDIASHFHINHEGTQVVNVAEFVDAQSHERLVHSSLQKDSVVMKVISEMEGVIPRGFHRFVLLASA